LKPRRLLLGAGFDATFEPIELIIPMATATSPFFRDTAFDPFLFAAVGEQRNGMLLSVVSALARLDLDPWSEAASLSKLPAAGATERLYSLLSSLPSSQLTVPAPATIARLVGLLPKATRDAAWSPSAADPTNSTKSKLSLPIVVIVVVAVVMVCAAQFADRREITAPAAVGASPTTTAPNQGPAKVRGE
jgi:hypothetical protein